MDTNIELAREKPEGVRWLELIGRGQYIGEPTRFAKDDGSPLLAEEFPLKCGDHVRPLFTALEQMDPQNPKYQEGIELARKVVDSIFSVNAESEPDKT